VKVFTVIQSLSRFKDKEANEMVSVYKPITPQIMPFIFILKSFVVVVFILSDT
jgi:hypothetical protein